MEFYCSEVLLEICLTFTHGKYADMPVVYRLYNASSVACLLADRQQNEHDKYVLRVYRVEILLMIDSGPVRNM